MTSKTEIGRLILEATSLPFGLTKQGSATLALHTLELQRFAERIARLNRDAGEIGPGMLATLVDEARRLTA